MGSINFYVGDIVIINREAYGGSFEGEIGYIVSMPFISYSYIKLFKYTEDELLFRNNEFNLYAP